MRLLIFIVLLAVSGEALAENRQACEIRLKKVIAAADKGNQCNDASDCRYVKVQDCVRGCAILPVHWGMYERVDIAADGYQATCSRSCRTACQKPVEPKCVKNKCDYGLRKWKYLTKEPQSLRE